jgi:hypothetical protein
MRLTLKQTTRSTQQMTRWMSLKKLTLLHQ